MGYIICNDVSFFFKLTTANMRKEATIANSTLKPSRTRNPRKIDPSPSVDLYTGKG